MLPGAAPMVDNLFLLAVAAVGWGLSLATYRLFARSRSWPMGALQADLPFIPVLIGLAGLFAGLPSPFTATRYHSLIVTDIPDDLVVNATAADASVMGVRHRDLPIHGVQFHPESIATEHGHAMLANFLRLAGIEAKALA